MSSLSQEIIFLSFIILFLRFTFLEAIDLCQSSNPPPSIANHVTIRRRKKEAREKKKITSYHTRRKIHQKAQARMNSTFITKAALPTRLLSPTQIYRRQRLRQNLRKCTQCSTISSLPNRPSRSISRTACRVNNINTPQFRRVCCSEILSLPFYFLSLFLPFVFLVSGDG